MMISERFNFSLHLIFLSILIVVSCSLNGLVSPPDNENPHKLLHSTKEADGIKNKKQSPIRPISPGYSQEGNHTTTIKISPNAGQVRRDKYSFQVKPDWPKHIWEKYVRSSGDLPPYLRLALNDKSGDGEDWGLRRVGRRRTFFGSRYHHVSVDKSSPTWVTILTKIIMIVFVVCLSVVVLVACLYIILSVAVFTEEDEKWKRKQARSSALAAGAEVGACLNPG